MPDYSTPDHHLFVFGQQRADGWACRKRGCDWQTYNIQWDRAQAQADHDKAVG